MANHVYREFGRDELLHTTVHAQPSIVVESGSAGWSGNTNAGSASLSLYGGVRRRADVSSGSITGSGLEVYPIDDMDTHSVDKVVGIPGKYPATGSINLAFVTNESVPSLGAETNTRWYEGHWAAINNLSDWYHNHKYRHYPALDQLPVTMSVVHVPEMFYGRQIATGTVFVETHAWDSSAGSNVWGTSSLSGARYYVDDGLGRLFDVPVALTGDWKQAWMSGTAVKVGNVFYNEGLVVFNHPSGTWHQQFLSASYNTVSGTGSTFHCQFSGSTLMKSMVFMCRLGSADANGSNNPSFYTTDANGKRWSKLTGSDHRTYVTAVGIYNEEHQLVAVAKIAQPIRKREQDNLDIRLKLDI